MNSVHFTINQWEARSLGLSSLAEWQQWAITQNWPQAPEPIVFDKIPPMMRRRMSNLTKLALQTALHIADEQQIDYIIFSSRHGELHRTVTLIESILDGDDASPIAFSQSVHNTAAGLYTIITKKPITVTSLSAGEHTLHSALIEAACYLADNPNHQVLLVDFDEPLPEQYQQFKTQDHQSYAFSAILSAGNGYTLQWSAAEKENNKEIAIGFPQTLDVIKHLALGDKAFSLSDQRHHWHWVCN
ncbi:MULTISPECIES: beta-ketoacyl synthase chain length factor [unclassified Photobacterium]|uniref:beta-ketoacyl synthase chain length factor n=1 Tax=unclassified Photobacterium TaxID=2628852 RepID=UPI001EDE0714|nr:MULTISPECIES: beta-ketoacyl synthase chain length factor [unclassified Photobacterium]MCG3865886.1 beta-ketoacyl synthase chain length factor [Photobacterium sp. Ph6]MCG3877361.1 beta-ketoacyl synthase chain length factor [Photobacterium sp. Ph5]